MKTHSWPFTFRTLIPLSTDPSIHIQTQTTMDALKCHILGLSSSKLHEAILHPFMTQDTLQQSWLLVCLDWSPLLNCLPDLFFTQWRVLQATCTTTDPTHATNCEVAKQYGQLGFHCQQKPHLLFTCKNTFKSCWHWYIQQQHCHKEQKSWTIPNITTTLESTLPHPKCTYYMITMCRVTSRKIRKGW